MVCVVTLLSSFVEEGEEEHTNSEIAAFQNSSGNKSLESTTWYTALTEENEWLWMNGFESRIKITGEDSFRSVVIAVVIDGELVTNSLVK